MHTLDDNDAEREYFRNLGKNGQAAYRRAVMTLTGGLPWWAVGPRTKQTNITEREAIDARMARPEFKALLDKMFSK